MSKSSQEQKSADRQANKESHGKEAQSGQQPAQRERNVGHSQGEEHSRRSKG
jgi:hypothetical protein